MPRLILSLTLVFLTGVNLTFAQDARTDRGDNAKKAVERTDKPREPARDPSFIPRPVRRVRSDAPPDAKPGRPWVAVTPSRRDVVQQHVRKVLRLRHTPAMDVAKTVNEVLRSERLANKADETVIVADPITNSLIISTPVSLLDGVIELVEQFDTRPPMVMIRVLIARVTTENGSSADVERLQDLSAAVEDQSDDKRAADKPVLSAPHESVTALVEKLAAAGSLEILARPQIMTLDNQSAFLQVGSRVPTLSSASTNSGLTTSVEYENVGLILGVTPRIDSEGLVTMELDVEKSDLSPEEEGTPVLVAQGEVKRAPRIDVTIAQTTITAADGQAVLVAGLTTQGDDGQSNLLIVVTPHVVRE